MSSLATAPDAQHDDSVYDGRMCQDDLILSVPYATNTSPASLAERFPVFLNRIGSDIWTPAPLTGIKVPGVAPYLDGQVLWLGTGVCGVSHWLVPRNM